MSQKKKGDTAFVSEQNMQTKWYLIDAKDKRLGRVACEIVRILTGKRRADYTPHCNSGDFVVVINAKHISYTGKNKGKQTLYRRHSGYPGGLKSETLEHLLQRAPTKVLEKTVSKMLPKATTKRQKSFHRLKVYAGAEHPHVAQKPILIEEIPQI